MSALYRHFVALAAVISVGLWWHYRTPTLTVLSVRLGQSFEEVVKHSTYPVIERSNLPADDPSGEKWGATWVTEPAVVIRFTDPKHGFTLPPTKFAALTYQHNTAAMLSTSPMLDKLPFDEVVVVLENLQNQFKAGGWLPYKAHNSDWFDLTPTGKKRLHAAMLEQPFLQQMTLRVPQKYSMVFRIACAEGCWTREPPYKFLIDIGVSDDTEGWKLGDPPIWDKSHPANQAAVEAHTAEQNVN
ncbi:MAG TPA: hypothetical protein VNT33_05880 [Telluria sp.]|nr:hypothetical protein [Telluria sp.]